MLTSNSNNNQMHKE